MATLRDNQERLGLQRERLRVRAVEVRRREKILENELSSTGISEAERDYLRQRLQTLSNEEDEIGQQEVQVERQIAEVQQTILAAEQEQIRVEQRRQGVLGTQVRRLSIVPQAGDRARLDRARQLFQQRQLERNQASARLVGQTKKAFILITVAALSIAALADILSIIDAGWVISWSLPLVTWFIVRRINAMNRSVQNIATAQEPLLREIALIRQRSGSALVGRGRNDLLTLNPPVITPSLGSYALTFMRDQVISQALECIPIIDWLPMYLGEVVKIIFDQRRAYRRAQAALIPYRQTLELLDRLERFELDEAASEIGISRDLIPAY